MKKLFCSVIILIAVITIPLAQAVISKAQEIASLAVAESSICRDVVDRQPIGAGESFEASVGKLYCFTKITGAQNPIEIAHVWYFGGTLRAKVTLPVNSSSWRTFSSKKIQAYEIGDWYVDVLGPNGEILQTLEFKITP
jgi:hypothetical protein